jgi:hypothetical protein
MYLFALIPPNNIDTALMSVKREIFRRTSVVSAWALRPMVPFAFYNQKPAFPDRKELPVLSAQGLSFSGTAEMNGQFFLQSDACRHLCGEIIRIVYEQDERGMLPLKDTGFSEGVSGLHLWDVSEEGSGDAEKLSKQLLTVPGPGQIIWKSCTVSLSEIETGGDYWWESVSLETIEEVKLRKLSR